MATTKYNYKKIIQGHFGQGWEDVIEYNATSTGSMTREERELLKNDLKEYKASGQGSYKVIFRKTLKSKGMKAPVKQKRTSAKKLCRQVIKVPGINSKTGHLLKGWTYKNGKPVKAAAKKASSKKGLNAPRKKASTPKQLAARKAFALKAKEAAKLVKSGKAKDTKAAWRILKK